MGGPSKAAWQPGWMLCFWDVFKRNVWDVFFFFFWGGGGVLDVFRMFSRMCWKVLGCFLGFVGMFWVGFQHV